jgi:K+-sensing histidine kinase KdpD
MISLRPQVQHKQPHLGIGLYIARLIAQFHQGQIHAENWQQDQLSGVVVKLSIPLSEGV